MITNRANEGEAEEAGVEPTGDAFAPPNGFEDRAGHRTRCSSGRRVRYRRAGVNRHNGRDCANGTSATALWFDQKDAAISGQA
jgi:hypothetical protein